MSKTKELFETEMYGESLNSTNYYYSMKTYYEEWELSEICAIFDTPISENRPDKIKENKNNITKEENYEKNFL